MRLPRFPPHSGFHSALRQAVETELAGATRDDPALYTKMLVVAAVTVALYAVYLLLSGPLVLLLAAPFGLALAAVGFNIQHDGGHESVSRVRLINRCAAYAVDLLGGSSYVWRWKHNLYHHTYPNVGGIDSDIALPPVGRLAAFQQRRWFHRHQHLYLWILYALLAPKWQFVDDFRDVIRGRIDEMPLTRPRGAELFFFLAGKCFFLVAAFVIPALVHGVALALAFYAIAAATLGVTLSVVFQLAHCTEEAQFVGGQPADEWAVHQLATTSDFAPGSRLLTWYLGGLNFQIEHHLFPRVPHVHYARIAPIVQRVCAERGVPYHVHETFGAALRSHYRMLKANGARAD